MPVVNSLAGGSLVSLFKVFARHQHKVNYGAYEGNITLATCWHNVDFTIVYFEQMVYPEPS
jgi:hypothetical protein